MDTGSGIMALMPYIIGGLKNLGGLTGSSGAAAQGGTAEQQAKVEEEGINYFGTFFEPSGKVRDSGDIWENLFNPLKFGGVFDMGNDGGLFGDSGGETLSADQLIPTFQRQTGEKLASWIQQYMDNFVPGAAYTGKMSAGMTDQEKYGMNILNQYLTAPNTGNLFAASTKQIEDTLAGKYADPNASPFIKAMKEVSNQDLQDAINTSRRGAGARGKFFSTASLGEEKDLTNRNLQNINSIIGNFIQNERQNMLNAVPTANAMDQYSNATAPLTKVQASQSLGSLSRTLEQADFERQYNDFLRQRTEQAMPISAAQGLYGVSQPYGFKDWTMPGVQNNTASQIAGLLSNVNWQGLMGNKNTQNNAQGYNYWSNLGLASSAPAGYGGGVQYGGSAVAPDNYYLSSGTGY